MNATKEATPVLRFALRLYRLYISFGLLVLLGNPQYLEFLFDDDRKLLVVSGSMVKQSYSYKIPERIYQHANSGCYISRMTLTEAFRLRMDWDKHADYRVVGNYAAELGVVVFDLTRAIVVRTDE